MAGYAHPEFLVDGDWLQASLGDPNLRIVDCDVRDAYRRAHIPGAVHIEWLNNVTADDVRSFKSADELREMFAAAGITPEKEVITV